MSSTNSMTAVSKFADALINVADQLQEANRLGDGRVEAIKDILLTTGLLDEGDADRLVNR